METAEHLRVFPRYRVELHRPLFGSSIMAETETLSRALVELATIRPWLRAAGEDGSLVVIDQQEAPERTIGTYRITPPVDLR